MFQCREPTTGVMNLQIATIQLLYNLSVVCVHIHNFFRYGYLDPLPSNTKFAFQRKWIFSYITIVVNLIRYVYLHYH